MVALTVVLTAGGALAGFRIAYRLDAATSAGMAVFYGLLFAAVLAGTRLARGIRLREPGSGQGLDVDGVGGSRSQREHLGPAVDQHAQGSGER